MRSKWVWIGSVAIFSVGLLALILVSGSVGNNSAHADADENESEELLTPRSGLPEAARAAIAGRYPDGKIVEVTTERRVVKLLVVEVMVDGEEHEVFLTPDGRVVEVSREVAADTAPEEVRRSIEAMPGVTRLNELERCEVFAALDWVELDEPRIEYEAEVKMRGREVDVKLDAVGTEVDRREDD